MPRSLSFRESSYCAAKASRSRTPCSALRADGFGLTAKCGEPTGGFDVASEKTARHQDTKPTSIFPAQPAFAAQEKCCHMEWGGLIAVPETGDYLLGVAASALPTNYRWQAVANLVAYDDAEAATGRVNFVHGRKTAITVHYRSMPNAPRLRLIWARVDDDVSPDALAAARSEPGGRCRRHHQQA